MSLHSLIKTVFYKAGYSVKKIRPVARSSSSTQKQSGDAATAVASLLHKSHPYEGFDFRAFAFDAHGWGGQSPAFRELMGQNKPNLIIEVGTWKGASALEMAAAAKDLNLPTKIVCIDTWLGAVEFWTDQSDEKRFQSLQLKNGYPNVYYQFLANVCHQGFQDRIIPFPQTASNAAIWFRFYGITADMIYLDASHEEEDVYQDLCNYWEVASDKGLLFGDDYHSWDGVRLAVEKFARGEKRKVSFVADKWIIRK